MKKQQFYVNSIGETPTMGSANIPEVTARLGRTPSKTDWTREFARMSRESHTELQHRLWMRWDALTRKWGNSLFRFSVRGRTVWLTTEFTNFLDLKDVWKEVRLFAKRHGAAKVTVMGESKCPDSISYDNGKTWIVGENNDRMERQVEVLFRIPDNMSVDRVGQLRNRLAAYVKKNELLNQSWQAVI